MLWSLFFACKGVEPAPDADTVQDALGGVLCRCTGYRKIIDAVMDAGRNMPAEVPHAGAIGDRVPRLDGDPKLLGTEVFGDDAAPAGTLAIRVLRSPHHHAGFVFGDLEVLQHLLLVHRMD